MPGPPKRPRETNVVQPDFQPVKRIARKQRFTTQEPPGHDSNRSIDGADCTVVMDYDEFVTEPAAPSLSISPMPRLSSSKPQGQAIVAHELDPWLDEKYHRDGLAELYIPLVHSEPIHPRTRLITRGRPVPRNSIPTGPSANAAKDTPDAAVQPKRWIADPSKLPPGKKAKYYGVRVGRIPGIYYNWPEAESQIKKFPGAVHASFTVRAAVEEYMNHSPDTCTSGCCRASSKAVDQKAKAPETAPPSQSPTLYFDQEVASADRPRYCECCEAPHTTSGILCASCYHHPSSWPEYVISKHELQDQQANVIRLASQGSNIFFTGAAGTGKTKVIHALQHFFRGMFLQVSTIAPTGIAALNVGGQTMHTYAGWDANAARIELEKLCDINAHMKKNWKRFDDTDVLIIDEISMIESNAFTRLSQMLQAASRHPDSAFGAKQVIVAGDFFQLPPVQPFKNCIYCGEFNRRGEKQKDYTCEKHGSWHDDQKWAFCSPVWSACAFSTIQLTLIFRQHDRDLTDILHACRSGTGWTNQQENLLLNHANDVVMEKSTKLMSKNARVDEINDVHMSELDTEPVYYECLDNFRWDSERHPELAHFNVRVSGPGSALYELDKTHRFATKLEIKIGMQVMLLANLSIEHKLVNGSTGEVIGFEDMADHIPRAYKKSVKGERGEHPLYGSTARYQESCIAEYMEKNREGNRRWPVVRFRNGEERVIVASCFVTELGSPEPYSLLSRTQVPLVAGWAVTIHKSQGLTLDSVTAELDDCFQPGQAYVALSRARSLKTIHVATLPKLSALKADSVVERFMLDTFGKKARVQLACVKSAVDQGPALDTNKEASLLPVKLPLQDINHARRK